MKSFGLIIFKNEIVNNPYLTRVVCQYLVCIGGCMFLGGLQNIFDNITNTSFSNWVDVIFFYVWAYTLLLGLYLVFGTEGRFLWLCRKGSRLAHKGRRITDKEIRKIISLSKREFEGKQRDVIAVAVYFIIASVLVLLSVLCGLSEYPSGVLACSVIMLVIFIYIIGIILCISLYIRRDRIVRFGEIVRMNQREKVGLAEK